MIKPDKKPKTLCLAPWTHTYISPQTERRLCCASREPAQSFKQYIDTEDGTGVYNPQILDEWWNSEHVRQVRRTMMEGKVPPECQVCNEKLLNVDVYRDYFWQLFQHHYDNVWKSTDETGYTTMKPISWDYRISNLCNFKCRMCGDMLSSSWETEQRQHNQVLFDDPKNAWMLPANRKRITQFQQETVREELAQAIEEHRVEEIYWVGGEPLMYEEHWEFMRRIIELGDGQRVYARYNTNLSRIDYRGHNLFTDILDNLRDWQICASLDGTGKIGEYIRTGLVYDHWRKNYLQGCEYTHHSRQLRIDFTLTLPGMFDIENIVNLADETNTDILAKVIFSFTPDIILSPLALPKSLFSRFIDDTINLVGHRPRAKPIIDVLTQLDQRPTFEEQWCNEYQECMRKAKDRILQLEKIRNDQFTMNDILKERKDIHEWWNSI